MFKKASKRPNLFLFELITAILFFSLCSAVCVQLFAKSRIDSRNMTALNHAVAAAESSAEIIRSFGTGHLSSVYTDGTSGDTSFTVYYGEDWQTSPEGNAVYKMDITWQANGHMENSRISVTDTVSQKELYVLDIRRHIPYTLSDRGMLQ